MGQSYSCTVSDLGRRAASLPFGCWLVNWWLGRTPGVKNTAGLESMEICETE